jgi:hypothetical protein
VAPSGVFVIDAKATTGAVTVERPLFGPLKLTIAGRNRTTMLDGLDRQVAAVRHVLDASDHADVSITGVLCFTKADLPLLRTSIEARGHLLTYRKRLAKRIVADGPLTAIAIDAIAQALADALPSA